MKYTAFAFATIVCIYASTSSASDKDATGTSSEPSAANAAVVETDHGEGLGPNGADLHVNPKATSNDAELLQDSLHLPELQVVPPVTPEMSTEKKPTPSDTQRD